MKKFDVFGYFYGNINEAGEDQIQQAPAAPVPSQNQTPDQVAQQQQQKPQPNGAEAFRKLQGQVISNIEFVPSGPEGGALKIKIKNSYQPFVISWVNGQVTATDMAGRTMMLSDNSEK